MVFKMILNIRQQAKLTFLIIVNAGRRFQWNDGFSKAAGLSYTSLLSIIPFIFVILGILSSFATEQGVVEELRDYIFRHIVPTEQTVNELNSLVSTLKDKVANLGASMLLFFVCTSLMLISAIEKLINETWLVYEPRGIGQKVGIFCAVIVIGPILVLSAWVFSKDRLMPLMNSFTQVSYFKYIFDILLPFVIDTVGFWCLYFLIPRCSVRVRSALVGAVVAATLFGFAKVGFIYYIDHFSSYDKVYGTLASIPVLLVWLYLVWSIILFGTECAYAAQNISKKSLQQKSSRWSIGDGKFIIIVQILTLLGKAFVEGKGMPTERQICEELGLSSVISKPLIDSLIKKEVIIRGERYMESPITLLRSPETIDVTQVLKDYCSNKESLIFRESLVYVTKGNGSERKISLLDLVEQAKDS